MDSFRKLPVVALVAGLAVCQLSACERPKEQAKDSTSEKPAVAAAPSEAKSAKAQKRLDLPVPKGQPQRGLRIPIYSPEGKLMMSFQIGVAEVVDADNIKMGELRLETFREDGEHEFEIDLPDSIFNAQTKELTSKAHVKIKRHDFEITGNSMTFNTETKVGTFGGGVKMVIYDARAATEAEDEKPVSPAAEAKPKKDEKK